MPMARTILQGGPKVALQMSPEPTEADLQFARQMGVEYVVLWTGGAKANYDYFASRRELFEKAGLKIYGFGNSSVHCQAALVLNLPERDEKVAEYKRYLRALGKAGIPYTTYAHMANGVWSTAPEQTRGGAKARAFDLEKAPHQTLTPRPQVHGNRALGQLHALHQGGRARRGRGRRDHRDPPGRPAGGGIGRHPALHLLFLRRLPAGAGDRRQPERGGLLVRGLLAGGRRAHGEGRAGRPSGTSASAGSCSRSISATWMRRCPTSWRRSRMAGTWTCIG